MLRSLLASTVVLSGITFGQAPSASASPTITTATCGKPVCTWNALGPITYTRSAGKPETVNNSFSVLNPTAQFTLHIDNNGVSSAVVTINGTQVLGPSDFDPNVTSLDRAVTLAANDTIQVQLRGKPGTSPPPSRDNAPQSGASNGKVYDLDAPGPVNVFPAGTLRRFRGNFSEYAVLDDARNNVVASTQFPWFARVSCATATPDIDPRIISIVNDIPADNTANQGTTPLSALLSKLAELPNTVD